MATADSHWRKSQSELHKLIGTIADFVSDSSRREAWLRILTEYPNEVSAAEKAVEDWNLAKSNYMEREIFEPGNEHLRDRTNSPEDLFPQWHQRNLAPSEFDNLPEHIQNAVYWDWHPDSNETESIPCFRKREKYGKPYCVELSVPYWCPLHFLEFDVSKRVHDPLPPSKTGRDGFGAERYTLPEICHALTLLHDLDGAFGELAPRDSQLYLHFNHESSVLRLGVAAMANDSWAEDLRPLANRLFLAISGSEINDRAAQRSMKATVNARMLATMQKRPESTGWTTTQWSAHLGCSRAAVNKAPAWQSLKVIKVEQQLSKAPPNSKRRK